MAWKIDKEKLLAESGEQERLRDEKTAQLRKMSEAGETLPAKLKDEVEAHNQRVIDIGEEVSKGDAIETQRQKDNEEFFNRMAPSKGGGSLDAALNTRTEVGRDGKVHEVHTVTRDAVSLLVEEIKREYGSRMDQGYVDQESEQLMLDMLRCSNTNFPARSASFEARRQAIAKRTKRTVVTTTDSAGGHLVPDDNTFMNQVQMAERAYGGLASVARVFTTATGAPLPIPTSISATTEGANVAENTAVTEYDLAFDNESMRAHMVTSGFIEATEQAIQDAGVNLPTLVGMIASSRINRREAQQLLLGTGANNQYQGATVGFTTPALGGTLVYSRGTRGGSYTTPASLTFAPLLNDWKHSIDGSYRMGPGWAVVLSDDVSRAFSGAVDTEGRPLFKEWLYGNAANAGGITLGTMKVLADYSFPALPAANQTGLIRGLVGNFDWFWCRKVAGLRMIRDPYTPSDRFAIRWIFGRRGDSRALFDGNTPAQGGAPVRRILVNVVN